MQKKAEIPPIKPSKNEKKRFKRSVMLLKTPFKKSKIFTRIKKKSLERVKRIKAKPVIIPANTYNRNSPFVIERNKQNVTGAQIKK